VPTLTVLSRHEFNAVLEADIVAAPQNVAGIGWSGAPTGWVVTGAPIAVASERLPPVVEHLSRVLAPGSDTPPFWLLCCLWDGWRERIDHSDSYTWVPATKELDEQTEWSGPPGVIPRLSASREWITCFSAHHDDPSAVLLPEAHYLSRHSYRRLRVQTAAARWPWRLRRDRAFYAGADYRKYSPKSTGPALRQQLKAIVARNQLPVDVALGQGTSRRRQLRNKYLLDIDGGVRTWDAWAWKTLSGSVVLSPESVWETWFTRAFEPWQHFVPLAADLSDLSERLEWCRTHDNECQTMAHRARRRAIDVYDHRKVERETAEIFGPKLGLDLRPR
jgi:Glycosyl transferase family 90